MKPIRALPLLLLVPLFPALWAALATDVAPDASASSRLAPLLLPAPAEVAKPLPGLGAGASPVRMAARPDALGPVAPAAESPRWPEDWPSLDAFPAGGSAAAMQMMGSGDLDVEVPGATEAPPEEEMNDASLEISDDEPEPVESIVDQFDRQPEVAERRRRAQEALRRREIEEQEKEKRDLEEFDLTDEEKAERRKQEEVEGRRVISEVDAEIDQQGDPFGQLPPLEPDAEAEGDAAEAGVERPATQPTIEGPAPEPSTGYWLTTPDGQPVERVVVGQSFVLELRVTPEDASIPGRAGGRRELDFIEVTLVSEEGEEQAVRLWRSEEPSPDGLVRFVSREPISIAARVNGNPLSGTIEGLDLDLRGEEDKLSATIRVRSRQDVQGGFTTFELYGKPITAAIAEVRDALDRVEAYLRNERRFVEDLMRDAEGDEEVRAELRTWLERIDNQLSFAAYARSLLEYEYNTEYKLVLSSKLLQTLIEDGPDGWEISESDPTQINPNRISHPEDYLTYERKQLDEKYRGRAMVQRAAFDVITPYLLTTYSQFAHITLGAPIFTLAEGKDEFGHEASRGWALVEIGTGLGLAVVAVKLPSSVHSFLDEGRLIPSKDLQFITSPRGSRPSKPGRLGETKVYEGTPGRPLRPLPGETLRAPRAPRRPAPDVVAPDGRVMGRAGVETAGGELPLPGRAPGRRGLDPETNRYWQERKYGETDPATGQEIPSFDQVTGEAITPRYVNRHLAAMDEAVATARQRGVPENVTEGALAQSRGKSGPREAAEFVGTRLELEARTRSGERILISNADRAELAFEGLATPQQLERITGIDTGTLESVIAKSHLEASGKPQLWTVDEIAYGRSIARRLEAGEDLSQWKTMDFQEGPGVRTLFGSDDLGAVRSTFTNRPLRVATETAPPRATGAGRAAPETPAAAPGEAPRRPVNQGAVTQPAGRETQRVGPPQRPARTEPTMEPAPARPPDGADAFGPVPRRPGTREPAEFIDEDPAGFLRTTYGETTPAARAYEMAAQELGAENVHGIAGSYAKGNPRARQWPEDVTYEEAFALDKLPGTLDPLDPRVSPQVKDLMARRSSMGGEDGVPSDIDIAVNEALDFEVLQSAARKIYDETGVLVEFTQGMETRAAPARTVAAPETPTARPATVVDPVAEPTALGGPSGRGGSERVEVLIQSLGGSTGRALRVFVANHGEEPVRIQGSGLALEPVELDEKTRVRAEEILEAASAGKPLPPPEDDRSALAGPRLGAGPMRLPASWRGANVVSVVLDGYCLELAGGVPTEGVFFRIADPEAQAANEPVRAILAASRALRDQGALNPDGDPEAYFHSTRQWAIWVLENGFDRAGFDRAFVEHVRKNFEAADREWTVEAEELLREFIPNRWNDVVAVLDLAGLPVPGAEEEPGRSNR